MKKFEPGRQPRLRKCLRPLAAIATVGLLVLLPLQRAVHAQAPVESPDDVILNRQLVMTQLDKDTKMLGEILAGVTPQDKLAETTRAIARGAKEAQVSFQANVPGGRTKPAAWERTDFAERMTTFVTNAEAMAKLAGAGNFNGVSEMAGAALPCKECHDRYREPKR